MQPDIAALCRPLSLPLSIGLPAQQLLNVHFQLDEHIYVQLNEHIHFQLDEHIYIHLDEVRSCIDGSR